jgi:thiosulfate reductase/polysulfide reductase chain A
LPNLPALGNVNSNTQYMGSSRREFIKISALGLGALGLAGTASNWALASLIDSPGLDADGVRLTPTYCEICFWKCAGWVHSRKDGDIWKIEGHQDDPHCSGRLCPRGTGGVGMYEDEDRLKTPLIRVEENGKQTFREASWDEAWALIASKLTEIKAAYGPETVALFTHGSGGKFWGDFLKAYGSTNITAPSFAQCRGPREVAFLSTFGEVIGSPERTDIRDTRCLVLIGSHLGENMHNGQVQEMSDAIDQGRPSSRSILVSPLLRVSPSTGYPSSRRPTWRFTAGLDERDHRKEWYDKDYVERYTFGFDLLKEHVKALHTRVGLWHHRLEADSNDRETARDMANAAPAVIIHPGRHVTWYGDDTQRLRAVAILNAILGAWGRRGGFYTPEKVSLPSYPHPPYPGTSKVLAGAFPGQYNLAHEVLANPASVMPPSRPVGGTGPSKAGSSTAPT